MNQFIISLVILACALLPANATQAAESSVVNSISVSSHSGGNSASGGNASNGQDGASGGTVITGSTQSSVDITTIINGTVVEDIHETATDTPLVIRRVTSTTSGNTSSSIRTDVRAVAGNSSDMHTAPLPDSQRETEARATSDPVASRTAEGERSIQANITSTTSTNLAAFEDSKEEAQPSSFVAHIVHSIRRALHYVLSNLFS